MQFYSKKEKQMLGRYFKYYRSVNKIKVYDLDDNNICDYKTYKSIENGKISKLDEIYDRICNYYSINMKNIQLYLNELETKIKDLYENIECYDLKETKQIINIIYELTQNSKEENYTKELLQIINLIRKFYVNDEYLNLKEIKDSIETIGIWNYQLDAIIIEMCEKSNWNSLINEEVFNELREHLNDNTSISQYWLAMDYILQGMYSNALDILEVLKTKYHDEYNNLRELEVMMRIFHIYRDMDSLKAENMTSEIKRVLDVHKNLPDKMKNSIHYSLGMYYYMNRKYASALNCFENSYHLSDSTKSLLFICACRSRLNNLMEFNNNLSNDNILFKYIYYFELKSKQIEHSKLEEYILNDLMKELKNEKNEEPLWSMFRYEMEELVKNTKKYKNYYIFQEKFHKYTQNCG